MDEYVHQFGQNWGFQFKAIEDGCFDYSQKQLKYCLFLAKPKAFDPRVDVCPEERSKRVGVLHSNLYQIKHKISGFGCRALYDFGW